MHHKFTSDSSRKGTGALLSGAAAVFLWQCPLLGDANKSLSENSPSPRGARFFSRKDGLFYGQCLERQLFKPTLPYPAWDYNWDGRMKPELSLERLSTPEGLQESRSRGVTRHILLIRHGQYDETFGEDGKRQLTALGKKQAHWTGQRLARLAQVRNKQLVGPCRINGIHVSEMQRAKETATIIASYLTGVPLLEPDPLLNEALPSPMIPIRPDIPNAEKEIDENHGRIEMAFRKYFYRRDDPIDEDRGDNAQQGHEFEIIVGHANVIRYFFCRALQLPPEAWLRLAIFNCSITYLVIQPNGYVSARLVGDTGHIPYEQTTFSSNYGYTW